jgi:uncharacterized protein
MTAGAVRRDSATAEFFDGTARDQFLLRRCADCGTFAEPYLRYCPGCESDRLEWAAAAGGATVVSWSVVHRRVRKGQPAQASVVVIAALDEGPLWWAEVLDADPARAAAEVAAGQRLAITFEHVPEYEAVPAFRRA